MKRFGLPAGERLKSRIEFEQLYTSGRVIFSDDKKIKAIYLIEINSGQSNVKMAAVVSSKAGNAVWRNRIKRLIRTSYRLNKENIFNLCLLKNLVLKIIFSPYRFNEKNNRMAALDDIMPGVRELLFKIGRSL
ncbi:MAG TPA: ribonuclease P protein component [Ignavibacteriaceae bacterium]|nr:ribonuclease P protein component [Ignavibacteriaceae bacterium]